MDKTTSKLELDEGDSEEYKVEAIRDSKVYAKESDSGHLPGLYYLVLWKGYPEEENTWEPASALLHLCKLISTFHRDHPEKPTATSSPIDSAPLMVRPKIRLETSSTKRKRGRSARANGTSKRTKKS